MELTKEEISGADCVTKVIGKLDELWKEDDKKQAINAYESFEQFRRPTEMGITEFLNAFERLINKLKKHNMTLPEGVLAYRVLKSANLTTEQEQLARATVTDITYKAMCDKLKSIFGDNTRSNKHPSSDKSAIDLKQEQFYCDANSEEVYYNNAPNSGYGQQRGGRGRPFFRSGRSGGCQTGFSSNTRYNVPNNRNESHPNRFDQTRRNTNMNQRKNPVDNRGQVSRCTICESTYHWMKDCPHRTSFTMFTTLEIHECYI